MDLLECQWCKAQNEPGHATCGTCGAPLDEQARVTDSGWKEAPRLRDLTEFGFSNSTCQVSGEIVPVAELSLAEGDGVFFEHHVMLWKDPALALTLFASAGGTAAGVQRMIGGMPHFLNLAMGPGRLAFSRDFAGELVVLPLQAGMEFDAREHAFLAGTHSLEYSFVRLKGLASALHGGEGMFMDRFVTSADTGLLLLHGTGNVFQRTLGDRETILVEPGAFLYKDSSVDMKTSQQKVRTGLATHQMFLAELTGPGRVGIQSVYVHHGE
jgi:uncharacterized protein (AIM24 family)